jgi:hypothetical protein
MGHAKPFGRRAEGDRQDLGAPVAADGLGAPASGPVGQPCGEPVVGVALAPGDHGRPRDAQPLGDLGVGRPFGRKQQDRPA